MEASQRGLEEDDQQLLQSALSDAFNPPPLVPKPVDPTPVDQQAPDSAQADSAANSSEPLPESDTWKAEYEAQVQTWREQSAVAREHAEKERARWEAIRAAEKEEAALRGPEPKQPLTEAPPTSFAPKPLSGSPSPADSRDLVTGESQKQRTPQTAPAGSSATSHAENTEKWEDIPSPLTSSFPSMSFPEHTEPSSPERKPQPDTVGLPSATLSVFDSSLSTPTRVKALLFAVAINLFLPFINGVMLGFGEIFAKNVVLEWFGWNKPSRTGRVATTAGIGISRPYEPRKTPSK